MADDRVNIFGEPLLMPPGFVHPEAGKYANRDEAFFLDKAVRIYVDIEEGGQPRRAAVWLDVLRFEDKVVEGTPVRVGIGRAQTGATGDLGASVTVGMELAFAPAEVFDWIEKSGTATSVGQGVYMPLAAA